MKSQRTTTFLFIALIVLLLAIAYLQYCGVITYRSLLPSKQSTTPNADYDEEQIDYSDNK
ncbi:MAG: hypothetical protein KA974_01835 [Saprospiraceae bacterium]|nr:hypothetical protein [Saprospiraceae bacterium]MBP7680149.1 hypothetical protein [Saprospiraceae bacterium]